MELFSDADTCDLIDQVYTVTKRNESAADDNVFEAVYEQTTLFELPGHLVFSLDNTLRTPVSYASTAEKSDIVVREISDGREDWKPILDLVYFDLSHRTVVAVAGETGTTMIQVEDRSTNCFREIMVTVREIAQGINIYKDDDSFRFFNADGTRIDTADSGQDWIFTDSSSGWKGSGLPMYGNYCIGESGAYVTFKTVATTLRIFYYGSITVTSDGFPLEVSANNTRTYEPLVVRFDNLEGRQHTVTIRLTTTGTQLDKYQATYPEETGVIDMNVADAPRIYWDRSFPNTASMKTGSSVTMGFYIVDRSGVEEVLVNGQKVQPQSIDANLSYVPVTFRENGTHVFEITSKQPGRKTTHTLPVYWFHTTVNSDAIATAPALDESLVDIVNRNGTPIHQNTDNAFLIYKAPVRPGEELHAYSSGYGLMYLDERDELNRTYASELRQYTGAFTLTRNGAQLLRIVAEDGTWRQTIRMLYNLIKGEPSISIYPENGILYLSGYADGPIQSVSVNGYRIPEEWGTSFSYPFPVTCSGDYTAEISDGRYTTRTTKYAWVPVTANDPVHVEMISDSACNVHFDPNRISGGQYNSGLSVPSENKYRAVYEYALVAVTNKTDTANPADATFGPDPDFTNIAFGWYVPMIRCADNWTDRVVLPAIRVGNVLDGELKIEGEPFHGRTLTAVYDGEVAGTLQYQWYRTYITTDVNGSKARTAIRGANGKEYVLVEDDILAKIDVEITSTGDSGKITSAQTEAVNLDADGWEGAYDGQMHTITVHDTEKYHAVFSDPWWTPIKDKPQGYSDSGRHWVTYYLAYSSSTKGRYNSISATRYIDIAPRDIRDGIVTLKKDSYLYTGEPITCEVESIYVGDISVPIDWRLGYRNRTATDPGQYTMTIIGFGDFTGEVSVDWEIVVGPGSPKPPEKPTEPTEPAEPTARPRPSKPDTPAKPAASAQPQTSKARSFTDVKADDWFAEGVRYVTERKLMNGVREGVFAPAQPVTRAMLVTILWRLDGSRYANYAMPFTDVPAQQWYTEAVRWAASEKLVEGVDKTRFDPDAPLSREQLAAILWRFAGYQNKKTASEQNLTQYQDAGSISLYAVPAFRWANETGLLGGTDATHLSPKSGATRAQIAAILMRYLENL